MRRSLSSLDGSEFDVIVIGAGVNGSSAAQHLTADGYRVILVDKGDFGSGSSSRSTRMLHCGLRYLARFGIDLGQSWALGFVRRASVPLFAAIAGLDFGNRFICFSRPTLVVGR